MLRNSNEQIRRSCYGPRWRRQSTLLQDPSAHGPRTSAPWPSSCIFQTTFCIALIQHLRHNKRSCFYVNLDPAAEEFAYEPDLDIKDLISLEDVMEEMGLGPNGGLIYCFEFVSNCLLVVIPCLELSHCSSRQHQAV